MSERPDVADRDHHAESLPRLEVRLLAAIAAADLALHLLLSGRYGYWIDELYFIACGDHLDWGYVDHPPLIAVVARLSRLLGDSLLALRFAPAVATAFLVFLTGALAREFGGGRGAQAIAAVAVCVVPVYTLFGSVLTMNSFEPLLWMSVTYVVLRLARGGDPRLWLVAGAITGVGILNKYSMGLFAGAMVAVLLLSPQRRLLQTGWAWVSAGLAALIALPHLWWELTHGWPTAELLANARLYQHQPVTPLEFVWGQVQIMHPLLLPLWLAGLYELLFVARAARFRFLGWLFVAMFTAFLWVQAKNYYLAPVYPILLAAGAVAIGGRAENAPPRRAIAAVALLLLAFLPIAPYVLPILPVEAIPKYMAMLGLKEVRPETRQMGDVPQIFADMLGWDELVAEIARVHQSLPAEEQKRALIWGSSYGVAGAVDYLGRDQGLPHAISGHQNYYLWRTAGESGEPILAVGFSEAALAPWFESVAKGGEVACRFCMPDRRVTSIHICRGLKVPMDEFWSLTKCWTCQRPAFTTTTPDGTEMNRDETTMGQR